MECFKIENLSFSYSGSCRKVLDNINIVVNQGEFALICGKSGCGKTTLLRLLKSSLSPFGEKNGNVLFCGKPLSEYSPREEAERIGFVMQSPDNQIVTDKVWHELAFGLESLGYTTNEIRARVAEMASFFGIASWFHKDVAELSGGQKQLLNLASVMAMQPAVLILDEPTSQLDPIGAGEFLKTLEKINKELGTTVIITEHRPEEVFPLADRVIVLDDGKVMADDAPSEVGRLLVSSQHDLRGILPVPVRVHGAVANNLTCPWSVRDGRQWLEEYAKDNKLNADAIPQGSIAKDGKEVVLEAKNVWYRYRRNLPDVLKSFDISVYKGEHLCILGSNGTGKTTALSVMCGLTAPYRGEVRIKGCNISKTEKLHDRVLAMLPQNPQSVFVKKTVYLDLEDMLLKKKLSKEETEQKIYSIASLCMIENLLGSHPYDLSGGEQQRAALAKVLLANPEILLLDEPTKGMDSIFKREFAQILGELKSKGVTVVTVSHDVEFCAEYADRCALVFDGAITSIDEPREFFKGKNFYTTAANRMARTLLPDAILAEDIVRACGGEVNTDHKPAKKIDFDGIAIASDAHSQPKPVGIFRKIMAGIFALLFVVTSLSVFRATDVLGIQNMSFVNSNILRIIAVVEVAIVFFLLFPGRVIGVDVKQSPKSHRKLSKRTLLAAFMILLLIPFTIYLGVEFLDYRKYYIVSLLIIAETMIPFALIFEAGKPRARELVVISVLCAIAVAGRAAFFSLPQFKPVAALVIIAGVCFGGETGFFVGAVAGFVSNFFFGQGPWTPWQMFAFGIIGFLGGILFKKGLLLRTRASLSVFGLVATFVIYGVIMNSSSVIMWQDKITWQMLATAFVAGMPYDVIHSFSTAFFLWFIAEPMIEKLERVKIKYGLLDR